MWCLKISSIAQLNIRIQKFWIEAEAVEKPNAEVILQELAEFGLAVGDNVCPVSYRTTGTKVGFCTTSEVYQSHRINFMKSSFF